MKTLPLITLTIALALCSCAVNPPASWDGTPNPLDEPGETAATVADLHEANIRAITNNPVFHF